MLHVTSLLGSADTVIALAIIGGLLFAECAFLVGFFLPGGDIILPVAGVLAAQGSLPLGVVVVVAFVASVAGYEVGYVIGAKAGPHVLTRRHRLFRPRYLRRTKRFYAHHGGKTIIAARFVGYVRTVVPLLSGIAGMRHRTYTVYNLASALLWTVALVMLGYWFGSTFTGSFLFVILLVLCLLAGSSVLLRVALHQTKKSRSKTK